VNNDPLNGLSDGTYRARWLREVLRSPHITESIKVMLLSLGIEEMDSSGLVSVPREEIAARIGRAKARVSERVQVAVDAGFLVRVSAGKRGSTAVFAAALNGSACADPIGGGSENGKGPATRTESSEQGPATRTLTEGGKGPATRTRTKFGSDPQDAIEPNRTKFGSDPQDAIAHPNVVQVRVAGPNEAKKGPPIRDAKVVEVIGGVELVDDSVTTLFDQEQNAAPRRRAKTSKRSPGTPAPKIPIPADFSISDDMRHWARDRCPLVDVDVETVAFVNHFLDKPSEKRPGWLRSWQTWMTRQQGWAKDRPSNVRHLRPTGTDGRPGNGSGARLTPDVTYSENLADY
jgi:hypothetical protein